MVLGFFKSHVDNKYPTTPLKFTGIDSGEATLEDILSHKVPELYKGASFWYNPLLPSGDFQTAYTGLKKFENVDKVCYKRRILNIELEDKTYEVEGEKLKYDDWEGRSTIAIDYVVPPGMEDASHEKYRPASQTKYLPPRTEYLNPEHEHKLLSDDSKPLVIALHGLSGGSYESYIRAFLSKVTDKPYDFDALVLNARGCANHTITSPQLFCGLWTNDLRYLINEHIRPNWPNKRIYLIGFSLGGAICANYLGQEADNIYHNIKGGAIMGCPWDFPDSCIQLQSSLLGSHIYSPKMCNNLVDLLNEHYEGHLRSNSLVDAYKKNPENFKLGKLKDFDDNFTSKLFGFNCADEYYRHASPIQRLLKVRVPLVIVNSIDDPVIGYRTLPFNEVRLNPFTALVTTTTGGHLGWFDYKGNRWYADPISRLFKELDDNWTFNEKSVEGKDLPVDTTKFWKYDRIVM